MSFLKSIVLAVSMFSAIPAPNVEWNEKNMRYLMCAFPLVGALIAFLCVFWFFLGMQVMHIWQKPISIHFFALGFTLLPVLVSGGIHVDGFMDTCDALASHADREKKLAILKDSHSGAFAVLGCVLYFLSFFVLSYELFRIPTETKQLILPFLSIFVFSRLLSACAVAAFPIAKNSGLVHTFSTNSARIFTVMWCEFFFILISFFLLKFYRFLGLALVGTPLIVFILYYLMTKRNFGGITGDTAGWFVQICEIMTLAVFVIEKILL